MDIQLGRRVIEFHSNWWTRVKGTDVRVVAFELRVHASPPLFMNDTTFNRRSSLSLYARYMREDLVKITGFPRFPSSLIERFIVKIRKVHEITPRLPTGGNDDD
ncbi:hypothetical protein GCM10008018_06180 [Paenibacillus marchantiophytorum]|uniref:Uncharacterized protein n=1 Tax=Paenibacillus marchantiophytorum TaxID=1619310 RepID=A0ABQ2BQH8_9BACL|nr:hypothetical protein GCM10008018_06180 [Paenibacillus marchantiophytorum]